MRICSWVALATSMWLAAPASAQIIIDSPGKGPVTIGRDKASAAPNGIVVQVGRLRVHTSDEVLNFSDFQNSPDDLPDFDLPEGAAGLSINLSLEKSPSSARTEAERIAELTRLLHILNDAANRQCEPIIAVYGKPCRLSESNLRAYFQPNFNKEARNGAMANTRFEIALPGAAVPNPKR